MAKFGSNGVSLPSEANSGAQINEAPPVEQRAPQGKPLGEGPIINENGAYEPASYPLSTGSIRTDR